MTSRMMICSWKKLWSCYVPEKDFERFEAFIYHLTYVVQTVINLENPWIWKWMMRMWKSCRMNRVRNSALKSSKIFKCKFNRHIRKSCNRWGLKRQVRICMLQKLMVSSLFWNKVQGFVEKSKLIKTVTSHASNLFNDNVLSYFMQLLNRRQKQITSDSFFQRPTDNRPETELTSDIVSLPWSKNTTLISYCF